MVKDVDHREADGERVPGDRILQMVVGQVDLGLPADRQAAGVGRETGLQEHRDELVGRDAGVGGMAGRSLQNQMFCAGWLSGCSQCCTPGARMAPSTVTVPATWPSGRLAGSLRVSGTQPRLTSTMLSSASCNGVTI